MLYLAFLAEPKFAAGPESLETALFAMDDIPWDTLAFGTVRDTLMHLRDDLQRGTFKLHTVDREETNIAARV
jgi:hypothetical protein